MLLNHIKPPRENAGGFLFGLEDWPPPGPLVLYALQWLAVMVPGLLVLAQVLARVQGLDQAASLALVQKFLLTCAVAQAAQVVWGHRLPGMVGTSTVLVVGAMTTASSGQAALSCGLILGGALVAFLGASGLGGLMRRLFTKPILASTLMLLAINLAPSLRGLLWDTQELGGGAGSFFYGLLLCLAMLSAGAWLRGIWSAVIMLVGLVLGSGLYHLAGLGPAAPPWQFGGLAWPAFNPVWPAWDPGVAAAMVLCYLAVMSNELAAVEALNQVVEPPAAKKRAGRALTVCGLCGTLAGLLGVPGVVTYSSSPALAITSRSKSRFTFLPAALGLAALAFWPSGLLLFDLAPKPVVGAILLYVMAASTQTSLKIISGEGGVQWREGTVLGAAMGSGMVVAFLPPEAAAAVPAMARPVLTNGFVVGLVAALVLEHVLLPRRA